MRALYAALAGTAILGTAILLWDPDDPESEVPAVVYVTTAPESCEDVSRALWRLACPDPASPECRGTTQAHPCVRHPETGAEAMRIPTGWTMPVRDPAAPVDRLRALAPEGTRDEDVRAALTARERVGVEILGVVSAERVLTEDEARGAGWVREDEDEEPGERDDGDDGGR